MSVVMKFGGTSVADPDAIDRLDRHRPHAAGEDAQDGSAPVVVVSALAGVTDALVDGRAAGRRRRGGSAPPRRCRRCVERHSPSPPR